MTVYVNQAKSYPSAGTEAGKAAAYKKVFIIADPQDIQSGAVDPLDDYLNDQGFEVKLSLPARDESEMLQAYQDNLHSCQGCIIYYGQGSGAWVDIKMADWEKFFGQSSYPRVRCTLRRPRQLSRSGCGRGPCKSCASPANFPRAMLTRLCKPLETPQSQYDRRTRPVSQQPFSRLTALRIRRVRAVFRPRRPECRNSSAAEEEEVHRCHRGFGERQILLDSRRLTAIPGWRDDGGGRLSLAQGHPATG